MIAQRTLGSDLRLASQAQENAMDQETFNLSIRRFLKMVGINSQREIEHAVEKALAERMLNGNESLPAKMTLEISGLKLKVDFDGAIELDRHG